MANERNALKELAEELGSVFCEYAEDTHVVEKAQRIIAELSHVSDVPRLSITGTVYTPHRMEASEAIIKCRAIAAE